jgi:hypothetical protein
MRAKGINYDTGFLSAGTSTHEPFDPEIVRRDMQIIRNDLHCTAVRITGGDPDRLEIAATHAADAGLEVWFCPFTNGLTQDALLALLADCAERAERLRQRGTEVVLLTGSEVSLFTPGFFPVRPSQSAWRWLPSRFACDHSSLRCARASTISSLAPSASSARGSVGE